MNLKEQILSFIQEELLADDVEIKENTSLFNDRILDSLDLVSLISFLETTFPLTVSPSEVTVENFDSISQLAAFIDRKVKK